MAMNEVTAQSGSAVDIQAAVNYVAGAGGGTVHIPPGTFYWNNETVTIPGGVNVIGASPAGTNGYPSFTHNNASTILHNNAVQVGGQHGLNDMFFIDGSNGKSTRISGIQFESLVASSNDATEIGYAIHVSNGAQDFRVDHNTFINFTDAAIFVENYDGLTERGVMDHNVIDNPYKDILGGIWGYGIIVVGTRPPYVAWDSNIDNFLGKYDTAPNNYVVAYIEDNHFSRCRHAIASNQEAWYVARYNLMDNERPTNYHYVDVHGTSGSVFPGGRGLEAYNNVIFGSAGYDKAIGVRGGGGVLFNNTFQSISVGITLWNESALGSPDYAQVHDLYIWGNAGATTLIDPNGEGTGTGYLQNVNYFLYAKPNYTPYPYPHPLTLQP